MIIMCSLSVGTCCVAGYRRSRVFGAIVKSAGRGQVRTRRIKPTCSVSPSTTMSRAYPGSELTVEQLVHALAQALDPDSLARE
jgi:hypothetical protein